MKIQYFLPVFVFMATVLFSAGFVLADCNQVIPVAGPEPSEVPPAASCMLNGGNIQFNITPIASDGSSALVNIYVATGIATHLEFSLPHGVTTSGTPSSNGVYSMQFGALPQNQYNETGGIIRVPITNTTASKQTVVLNLVGIKQLNLVLNPATPADNNNSNNNISANYSSCPTLSIGSTMQLFPPKEFSQYPITYTWNSYDPAIASVDKSGVVTAVALGNANIGLRFPYGDGYQQRFYCIKVVTTSQSGGGTTGNGNASPGAAPDKVTITAANSAITVPLDQTLQMYAAETPAPSGNPTIVWSVINDYGSATISATGLLTPKTMGSVRVTATDGVGSNSTYTINIVHPAVYSPVLTSLTVNDSGWARASDNNNVTMYYGSTHQLDIKAYDQYGASMAIPNLILTDYTDPNKPVVITTVTISPSGLVTAPQANVATRPVMYYLGISAVNSNGATIVASLLYNSTVPGANKFYLTIYKTPPAVQSIKLACSNNVQPDTIMVGRTQDCYASDQTTAPVYGKCSSDNPSVSVKSVSDPVSQFQNYLVPSTVHYNGPGECLITGVSTGAATITMSFNGITSNAWQVNVVSLTCPTGQLLCGNTCCVNSSFTCQSGQCVLKPQTVCPTGETQCANGSGCCNTYTNPSLNPNGNINTQTPSQMCSAGEMPCATYCIPGSACVNGACVTTSDHVAGQCNPACKSGQFCYQGVCGYVNSGSVNTPLTTGPCSPSALGSTSGSSFASTSSAGIANNTSNNTGTGTNNNSSCNTGTFACGSTCCTNAQTCFHGACVAGGASGACPAQEYSCGSNYACCALNQVCYLNSYCLNASQYPASSCTPACGQGQICYYGTCQSVTSNSADSNTSTSGTSSKSASVSASGATSNQAQSADNSALIAQLQEEIQSLMKQIQQIIAARSAK